MLGTMITKGDLDIKIETDEFYPGGYTVHVRNEAIRWDTLLDKAKAIPDWFLFDGWIDNDPGENGYAIFHIHGFDAGVSIGVGELHISGERMADDRDAILDGTRHPDDLGLTNMLEVASIIRNLLN